MPNRRNGNGTRTVCDTANSMGLFKRKSQEPDAIDNDLLRKAAEAQVAKLINRTNKARKSPNDQRLLERILTNFVAVVVLGGNKYASCWVVDRADSGMRLRFNEDTILPDEFPVYVPSLQVRSWARVVWRDGMEYGVKLIEP